MKPGILTLVCHRKGCERVAVSDEDGKPKITGDGECIMANEAPCVSYRFMSEWEEALTFKVGADNFAFHKIT